MLSVPSQGGDSCSASGRFDEIRPGVPSNHLVQPLDLWCRVRVVNSCKRVLALEDVAGTGAPDLATVDRIARLALWAKRAGGRLVISELSPRLRELLDLAGLSPHAWGWRPRAGEPGQEERPA